MRFLRFNGLDAILDWPGTFCLDLMCSIFSPESWYLLCVTRSHMKRLRFSVYYRFVYSFSRSFQLSFFFFIYRIYSINRPGRLLNFWTLIVGAYSRWALIRGWALIKFSPFSASVVCLFCYKIINCNNKKRRSNKARLQPNL